SILGKIGKKSNSLNKNGTGDKPTGPGKSISARELSKKRSLTSLNQNPTLFSPTSIFRKMSKGLFSKKNQKEELFFKSNKEIEYSNLSDIKKFLEEKNSTEKGFGIP